MSQVTDLSYMFQNSNVGHFELSAWNVARVQTMAHFMDGAASFGYTGDLSAWQVSSQLTDLSYAFRNTGRMDADFAHWNVQNVITMEGTFHTAASFTGRGLDTWQTSSWALQSLAETFMDTWAFNADISSWNTAHVTDMRATFESATAFNQDLSAWNVSSVTNLVDTFRGAAQFNQNLCAWRAMLPRGTDLERTFGDSACPDTSTPIWQDHEWVGSMCHVCQSSSPSNSGNSDGSNSAANNSNNNSNGNANTDHLPLLPNHDSSRPKFSSDDDDNGGNDTENGDGQTVIQVVEHDIDVVALVVAFLSGGVLVGWLVRRHMLRQRIYRRHLEVYSQVQPYDMDEAALELTSTATSRAENTTSVGTDSWDVEGERSLIT